MIRGARVVLVLAIVGCAQGPPTAHVWGKVSFEGAAITEGTIEFIPIEGTSGPTVGAVIANGAYDIPAKSGPLIDGVYRVELRAVRETGRPAPKHPSGKGIPERESIFPPEYSTNSTLRVKISATPTENQHDFLLTRQGGSKGSQ
jgi:hypothetical protein